MISNCIGNCGPEGPPPDSILLMPPPPLPSFLLPKSALLASLPTNNDSNSPSQNPCFASFLCEPNPRPRESEFVEFNGDITQDLENTWLFILISSCVGVLILGGLLAVILLKCKDAFFSSCSFSYHDSNMKQATMPTLGESSKANKTNSFMAGGILYPCASTNNRDTLQSQLNDSRLLWATLTPHGTRHFVADNPAILTNGRGTVVGQEGHYEVVDYRTKVQSQTLRDYTKRVPHKSFDNNGFVDYDYEDPTPLMDSYHDDLDSGYQEPQEIMSSLPRVSPRPVVSSPTRIDNPNMAPLNYYPSYQRNSSTPNNHAIMPINTVTTMNRKTTVNRRISDASSFGKGPNI